MHMCECVNCVLLVFFEINFIVGNIDKRQEELKVETIEREKIKSIHAALLAIDFFYKSI